MANEPWFYGSWGRFGPFSMNPAQRALAEKRWGEIQAEMMRQKKDELSNNFPEVVGPAPSVATPAIDYSGGTPAFVRSPMGAITQAIMGDGRPPANFGVVPDNVGAGPTSMGIHAATGATPEEVKSVQGNIPATTPGVPTGSSLTTAIQRLINDGPRASEIIGDLLPAGPAKTNQPRTAAKPIQNIGSDAALGGANLAPPPAAAPMETPQPPSLMDQIAQQRAFIDQLFPKRDMSDTQQQQTSDAFAQKELERTRLMAQLALSAGITAGAGAGFEEVGRGLAAAGSVYGKGFDRYQQALQAGADRAAKLRDVQYGDELMRQETALKLYQQNAETQREGIERRRQEVLQMLQKTKPEAGEFGTPDPAETAAWLKRYERYILTGEYEPSNVVDVTK